MNQTQQTAYFKTEVLTDERLRSEAHSIFATAPMSGLSTRYTFVPTVEIITGLREKGWLPVAVEQQRVRSSARLGFQKHMLRFRRAEQMETVDEWNAELILTNSHDAAAAYLLQVGIFRRLCSNGLVVSDDTFEAMRFRHSGLKPEEIIQASYRVLEYAPRVGELISRFRNRLLTPKEALTFAEAALLLRYENMDQSPVNATALLDPRRVEDRGNDLWTTFNRVQENLIRGGVSDAKRDRSGRLRSVRALKGIDSKVSINKKLWSLAEAAMNIRN